MSKLQGEFSFQLTDVSALVLLQPTQFAAFMNEHHEIDNLACYLSKTTGVFYVPVGGYLLPRLRPLMILKDYFSSEEGALAPFCSNLYIVDDMSHK